MSFTFSQAVVAGYLADCSVDTALSVRLKSVPIAEAYSSEDKTTEVCPLSSFGMTSKPLTDTDGEAVLTWYQEVFLVNQSPLLENERVSLEKNRLSGSRCYVSYAKHLRSMSLWKMPHTLCEMVLPLSLEAWTKQGMMRDGVVWKRVLSVRPISESDAGFSQKRMPKFPTPGTTGLSNGTGNCHTLTKMKEQGILTVH